MPQFRSNTSNKIPTDLEVFGNRLFISKGSQSVPKTIFWKYFSNYKRYMKKFPIILHGLEIDFYTLQKLIFTP